MLQCHLHLPISGNQTPKLFIGLILPPIASCLLVKAWNLVNGVFLESKALGAWASVPFTQLKNRQNRSFTMSLQVVLPSSIKPSSIEGSGVCSAAAAEHRLH